MCRFIHGHVLSTISHLLRYYLLAFYHSLTITQPAQKPSAPSHSSQQRTGFPPRSTLLTILISSSYGIESRADFILAYLAYINVEVPWALWGRFKAICEWYIHRHHHHHQIRPEQKRWEETRTEERLDDWFYLSLVLTVLEIPIHSWPCLQHSTLRQLLLETSCI